MFTSAWKSHNTENGTTYSVQFNEVPWRLKKTLEDSMKDWTRNSYGWSLKSRDTHILIYSKVFKSEEEWTRWATSFPMDIHETRYWGDKKKVIIHKKVSA